MMENRARARARSKPLSLACSSSQESSTLSTRLRDTRHGRTEIRERSFNPDWDGAFLSLRKMTMTDDEGDRRRREDKFEGMNRSALVV